MKLEPLTPEEELIRRLAVRELSRETPDAMAHRNVLQRIPIQKLINLAIEQGLFDRVKTDG
jgi:hypothetical protein